MNSRESVKFSDYRLPSPVDKAGWLKHLLFAILLLAGAKVSFAHESQPLYLELNEQEQQIFVVQWRVPLSIEVFNIPEPVLPAICRPAGLLKRVDDPGAHSFRQLFECSEGLAGKTIQIQYPLSNPSVSSLIQVRLLTGATHTELMGPGVSHWQIPEQESRWGVALEYLQLGIEHILGGVDHLLFVGCLLLIARTPKRVLVTVTGFTLAHSLTLVLSALELVTLPVAPIEAVIMLSVLFLATEIARNNRNTITCRFPVLVAVAFGFLHGFGFATVLREIGLPQTELVTGLLFFNLGVEVGQLVFIVAVVPLVWVLGRLFQRALAHRVLAHRAALQEVPGDLQRRGWTIGEFEKPLSYPIGIIASFWLIERLALFF